MKDKKTHVVYIAFGSNIGDKKGYIDKAIQRLEKEGFLIDKISKIIETEPYGVLEQDTFLNGVVKVKTILKPQEVLSTLMKIEKDLGRTRELRWGPRTIDLDILFYDNQVIEEENLKIPHVDIKNRRFVLEPICDIEPDYIHPVVNKSMIELLRELK